MPAREHFPPTRFSHASQLLTISLISHQQGDIAQHLLDGLAAMDSHLLKVIVTLNVPEDWEPVWYHQTAALVVVRNPQPKGFGANHNAAFARCDTPFFAMLNPDLDLDGLQLANLLRCFDDPMLALVSPTVLTPQGERADIERDRMSLPNLLRRRLHRPPGPTAWIAGVCLFLRAEAFRDVGGFDERYFMYCEDADLCGRLVLAGWRFAVDPTVRIVHDARRRSLRSPRHFVYHLHSLLRYWCSSAFWAQGRQASCR